MVGWRIYVGGVCSITEMLRRYDRYRRYDLIRVVIILVRTTRGSIQSRENRLGAAYMTGYDA